MILTYSFFHRKNFDNELLVAKQIADYAVANKHNKKLLSSKYVANFNLKSAIIVFSPHSPCKIAKQNIITLTHCLNTLSLYHKLLWLFRCSCLCL